MNSLFKIFSPPFPAVPTYVLNYIPFEERQLIFLYERYRLYDELPVVRAPDLTGERTPSWMDGSLEPR